MVVPMGRVDVRCNMSRLARALAHPPPSMSPDDEKQKRCVLHPTLVGTKRNSAMLKGAREVCKTCGRVVHVCNHIAGLRFGRESHALRSSAGVLVSVSDIQSVLE